MTVYRVPEHYGTISEALASVGNYSTIVISEGTYTEHIDLSSKIWVMLRSELGHEVIINGVVSNSSCVNVSGSTGVQLRGLTFQAPSGGRAQIIGSSSTANRPVGLQIIDCEFHNSAQSANTGTAAMITLGWGAVTGPATVRRCKFYLPNVYPVSQCILIDSAGSNVLALIEQNLFCVVNCNSTMVQVDVSGAATTKSVIVRNNTFLGCTLPTHEVSINMGTLGTLTAAVYNNVIYECVHTGSYGNALEISSSGSYALATVDHNVAYAAGGGFSASSFVPNTSNNLLTDPGIQPAVSVGGGQFADYSGRIVSTSGSAYRNGVTASAFAEEAVRIGLDRIPYASTPSRGCYEYSPSSGGAQVLYVKRRWNPREGIIVENLSSTPWFSTSADLGRMYNSPMELAEHVEIMLNESGAPYPIQFWCDLDFRYHISCTEDIGNYEFSGDAERLFAS